MPTTHRRALLLLPLLVGLCADECAFAQSYTWAWAQGIIGTDDEEVADLVTDNASGAVYAVGYTKSNNAISGSWGTVAGNQDAFVVKYSAAGAVVWGFTPSGAGESQATGVALDAAGNIYITGWFKNTIDLHGLSALGAGILISSGGEDWFVASYTPAGLLRWCTKLGGTSDERPVGIAASSNGAYAFGTVKGNITTPFGSIPASLPNNRENLVLVNYSLLGVGQSLISGGSGEDELANSVVADDAGVYVACRTKGNDLRWYGPTGILLGNALAIDEWDQRVTSFTTVGAHAWTATVSELSDAIEQAPSKLALGCGALYLTGLTHGPATFAGVGSVSSTTHDFFYLGRIERVTGQFVWVNKGTSTGPHHTTGGTDLAVGQNGLVHVVGKFKDDLTMGTRSITSANGKIQPFIASFRPTGSGASLEDLISSNDGSATAITADDQGNFILAGSYKQDLACAALSLSGSNNGLNGFLVKGSIPALAGVDISFWNAPATMCSNAAPLDLSTLVSPYQTGNAVSVVTSSNVFSPPSILGGVLGNYAQFNTANGYVTVDLGVTVPVGGIISLLWNANGSGAMATTLVGTANPPTSAQSSFTTSSNTDVYTSIVLTTPARYIRITRSAGSPAFDVDGIYYEYGNDLGGTWTGPGVTGSTFDPTGLSGPVSITYTVGTPPCTTSSSNSINVEAAPVGGSISSSVGGMLCPGNNSGTLTLAGYTGSITAWLMSTDGFASSTVIANTTATQTFSNLLVTTQYRVRVGVTGCGIALSGIHTVQVGDNTAPVITTCPPAQTIYVGATCQVALPNLLPGAAGTDNCSTSLTWSQIPAAGVLLNRGIHVVTITATDASGNSTTCNVTITAADNTAPVITGCPSNISMNADPGECSAIYNFTPPTATDNCGIVLSAINVIAIADVDGNVVPALLAPNEYPVGVTTRTFTFSDASGNISTCSFTITVVDTQFPTVVSCSGNITVPADAGACGANVSYTLPTFNDNCLFRVDLTEGLASGAFFPVGTTQVEYMATDSSNHSVNCFFNVIVQDLQNPVITGCPSNIFVQAPLAGTGATATWAPPTATDNCGAATVAQTAGQAPGSFFLIGTHTITYTATGPNGGTSTCTFTVTVISNGAPTITCPANQTLYSTQANCAQVFNYATPPVSDDLPLPGGQPVQIDGTGYSSGSAFPKGTTVQTWRVTDSNANSTTCTFNVQVIDTIRPTLQACPTNITLNANAGSCGATYTYTPPTAMDNCDGALTVIRVLGPASGSLFPIGTTIVRHRATDLSGRFRNCAFTVTVLDNILPTLSNCPADMLVSAATNACGAYVTFTSPTPSDNCSAALTQTLGPVSGSLFPIGDTPVQFRATDPTGNFITCDFNVHVDDTTPPTFTYCPDTISVTSTLGLCGAAVTYAAPVAADNCSSVMTLPAGQLSGAFFPVGHTSVTYTATDGTNAPAVCTFVVEVIDNQAPAINGLPGNIDMPNTAGVCEATITWTAPTASDNCSATLTSTHASGDVFPVGTTTVTYTATDGTNSTAQNFLITVTDNDDPTITCSANDTLSISSATCDVVMPVYAATATDNCAVDLIWQTAGPVAGDVLSVIGSPYSTTWFARDTTGNNSSCVQSIVVVDVDAPDVICPLYDSIEYYLDANCQLAFPDLRDSVTVADCSAWTNTMWPPAGMVFSQDTVVQMTMDIDDIHGNHRDNDHLIWIRDTIAPVIICPSDTIVQASPATCLATITPAPLAFGDNCSATSWTSSLPAGSYPAGVYPITLTAIAGTHTATCSYAVAVRDTMIACTGSNTFTAALAGDCTANVTLPVQDTTTVDLCGPWTWGGSTHSDGAWAVNDTVPVTYTVIDAAGFPHSCAFEITVMGSSLPDFTYNDLDICSTDGTIAPQNAMPTVGASYQCTTCASPIHSDGSFDAATIGGGTHTIVCDAPCYNAATDTVYITVHDDPAPTLDYGIASICGDNGFVSPVAYSPLGGIFSSPLLGAALGAIGEIDLSLVATSATYTINYAIGGPCPQSISADLTIGLPPDAGDSDIMSICSNAAPVALFPLLGGDAEGGGTWTAPGGFAFGGTYDPAMHASGIYSYAVLGAAPCANETETITVTEVSAPNAGSNGTMTVCSNGSNQSLMAFLGGFPANGGTWSGPSPVVGFTYDPVTMVPGVYTYTVTGNPPCANATATVTVTETPAPAVTTGTYGPLCSNGAAITLAGTPVGGTWTGTGVTGNSFDPAAGTQTLTYTVTAGGCTNSAVTTIAVNPAPVAGANTALALCTTSGMTSLYPLLVGAQPGGIWYKFITPAWTVFNGTVDPSFYTGGGTFTYRYIVSGNAPCTNDTAFVAVTYYVAPTTGQVMPQAICSGDPVVLSDLLLGETAGGTWTNSANQVVSGSVSPTSTETYTYAVDGTAPCADATADVTVTVTPSTSNSTTASACDSYTWAVNGSTYNASGIYTNVVGCHTETLDLTITPSTSNSTTASACDSYVWAVNGTSYNASGIYTNVVGCHTETLDLTITPSTSNSTTASACDSYLWPINSQTYTTSGTYTEVIGCTTHELVLTINISGTNTATETACDSYLWPVNSQSYTTSGTYTEVIGCTTHELVLTINTSGTITTTETACDSYLWPVNSQSYTTSGTYTEVIGCTTHELVLTINTSGTITTTETACDSYLWPVNSQTYTTSGTYTEVIGCTTHELVLTINISGTITATETACDSYLWPVNSQTYTTSGTYTEVVGCTTHELVLTINTSGTNSTSITACDSYLWPINSQTYTTSGTYTEVIGCTTHELVLTINTSGTNSTSITACDSYLWPVNNQTYTTSGTYTEVIGCTTHELVLTINTSGTNSTSITACDSYTWPVNSQIYTTSGTYTEVMGCTTHELVLTINTSGTITTTETACDSYLWPVNSQTYTTSGTYTEVIGCTTHELVLTINTSGTNSTSITACDSYLWPVNSQTYTTSGTYTEVIGCTTHELVLTINTSGTNSTSITACDSYLWPVNNQTYTTSGTYTEVIGCTTHELVLTINTSGTNSTSITACDSYLWPINSQTYTTSGTYTEVMGCTTHELVLTINTSGTITTTETACDSYLWPVNNQTYTTSGTYTEVIGCTTHELVLTINTSGTNSTSITACDSYTWPVNSQIYTTSGTYTEVMGCTTHELVLTINTSGTITTTETACDSYLWPVNSQTYTTSGTYTEVIGCTTHELVLTINTSGTNSTSITACDSYLWPVNSQTYTTSGTYTEVVGCTTHELVLTINISGTITATETACDSYLWPVNSQTYTTGGTYTEVIGCTTHELVLTINTSGTNSTSITACDSYLWPVNNQTYTTSGTYTEVIGCTTHELVLTINTSGTNSTSITACDSYLWPINSQTYTTSGTYTEVIGCTTHELVLTINISGTITATETACDSYLWPVNSQTYTTSGTYTEVVGCTTHELVLTINNSGTNTATETACDSYLWPINSQTYTTGGTYTEVIGCTTHELVLTINTSGTNSTSITACDSYLWPVNNQTYTTSGTYTEVIGCTTHELVLTINTSGTNSTSITACDSYLWPVNSQTYTTSGTYTEVIGCTTHELVLTINTSGTNSTSITACDSYLWPVNSQTYTTSGTYTEVIGCTTHELVLTISQLNDGDACTSDTCVNGVPLHTFVDADNDGVCDANDNCPGFDDNLDTDTDGTADCNDLCPNDPNKVAPGLCGCGVAEGSCDDCLGVSMGTAIIGSACNDNDPCTFNDVYQANCACVGQFIDTDGDATADICDACPNDPNKIAPGICGCGVSDVDTDTDGTADCDDGCPNDPNKVAPGNCGCGVAEGTCLDCAGIVNGTATMDACGICSGGTTGITPNSTCLDCAGIVNGTATMDACGICSGGTTGITPNSTCLDCAGIVNGTATMDACGICSGGTTGITPNSTCLDCAGIVNGTATMDACGICSGGTTGITPNSTCLDCAGIVNGTATMDACGICSGGTTGITPNSTCLDCAGIVNGSDTLGASCNDNDPLTGNDTWDANCTCAGLVIDCNNVAGGTALPGTPCDDGNANSSNDTWTAGCLCVGVLPNDCLGIPGGTAQPGTACDDNDPLTGNDTWDASCACVGLLIDCNNVAGGTALPGTPCDDGNANSSNDTWTAGCGCVGTLPNDCLGIPGGTAQPGTACDDNDPLTGNDTWDASCACAGLVIDCNSVAGGTDLPGTPCDDGNANSSNDTWTAGCLCVGVLPNDCLGIPGGTAQPGTACDDNDPLTGNDMWDANCSCAGLVIDCNNVAGGTDLPGSACDDDDLLTGNDTWDATCNCAGTPVNPCDAPVITTFTSTGPLCLGESVLLETSVVGTAPFVFDWSGPGSTLSGSGSNVTIPNAQSGTYQVIVTNACGDDTATVVVVVNPLPDASFLYSEPMYCQNSFDPSPTISTLGGVFSPSNSGLIIDAANGTIDLDASPTGVYIITYSLQANGCSALHTEQLTIAAPPIANWSSPGSLCDGIGTVNLNNYLDTGTIPGGTWSGAGVNGDYFDPSGLAGMIEITYTATVGDCSANGVGYITITPAPVALAGPDAEVCGLQHQMNATLQTAVGYWTPLNGGTVSVSTDPTTMVSVTAAGAYSFLWTVGDGQCFDNDTVRVTFSDPAISPVVDAGPDQELNVVDHTLLDGSTNGTQWSWSLASGGGNITDNDDLNTEVYLLGVGSNTFILSASNGPCPSTMDTVVIIVNELAIPTGFSPNGDGTNDVLVIPGIEEYKDNSLIVFDRWGRKVYEQERYANDWEGKALPDDTYFMVLNIAEGRTYNGYLIIKH